MKDAQSINLRHPRVRFKSYQTQQASSDMI